MKELGKLFEHTLMDIYYAENQILKALQKLAQKAKSPERLIPLRPALQNVVAGMWHSC